MAGTLAPGTARPPPNRPHLAPPTATGHGWPSWAAARLGGGGGQGGRVDAPAPGTIARHSQGTKKKQTRRQPPPLSCPRHRAHRNALTLLSRPTQSLPSRIAALLLLGCVALAAAADTDAAAAAPAGAEEEPLSLEETDKIMKEAGFTVNPETGLYDAPAEMDKTKLSRQVLLPHNEGDTGAFVNMLLDSQHQMLSAEYGQHSIPAGVSFLIKEYQQLVADTLAILGITQPLVEMDWLAQHVQYKIQEFIQLLNHISPTLASHVSINNPFYTDRVLGATGAKQTSSPIWNYQPTFYNRGARFVELAANIVQFRPCLITVSATGASVAPRLINITPRLIQVSVKGASVEPRLIKIDPAVIRIKPIGFILQPRLINVAPVVIEASPTITVKDDKVKVPKTEKWGAPIFDFSGKGATVDWTNGKTKLPSKDQLPPLPKVPKFNKNALKYQG